MAESGTTLAPHIRLAQVVLPSADLAADLRFFTERLGFKVNLIMPADAPSLAVINGHGLMLRLEAAKQATAQTRPLALRLLCDLKSLPAGTPHEMTAPGGAIVTLIDAQAPVQVPDGSNEFVITRAADHWGVGRAGMQYRDLIPSRLGGRFIASHIRIPDGGPVPDYVHFHKIRFQMIFCKAGWVKVVYEDQGEPFVLEAGDCVLQPPEIRHRVLEASLGLEVIEIGCPAVHETCADQVMALPTGRMLPERDYGGQRFVRHVAKAARWERWKTLADTPHSNQGFQARDLGIAAATDGLAGARVVRAANRAATRQHAHGGEFNFLFVLQGALALHHAEFGHQHLDAGDSCVLPAGAPYSLSAEAGLEMLEVTLPATLPEG